MSVKLAFVKNCGPGGVNGCTFGDWIKMLSANRFAVEFGYWPRAAVATCHCMLTSFWATLEKLRFSRKVAQTEVAPPLFVLGVWRSGTTHLHNLLSKDDRYAFPNTFQVFFPHIFLSTEHINARFMHSFMPATRPMDNVKYGVEEPQEDEFALAASGLSFMLELLAFPRAGGRYRKYLSFRGATPEEIDRWKAAWLTFLRKLSFKYGKPLILKSPAHTARIKTLLELFPDAKFIHIHRHPYAVFQSTIHTWRQVAPWWAFQKNVIDEETVIRDYAEVFDAFFEQRHLVPQGHYCEVAFDDLERDPVREVRRIYERLQLPEFAQAESAVQEYVDSLTGYSRNRFPELPDATRQRLAREWARCFDEWDYAK